MRSAPRDRFLIIVVAALLVLGLVMVQSASGPVAAERAGDAFYYVKRQGVGVAVGLVGGAVLAWMPHAWLRRYAWAAYGLSIASLIAVFVPGISHTANGASRWIGLGSFHLQPSEFAKIALALALAHFLDRHSGRLHDLRGVLAPALLIPAPILALVILEPDFGTTVILGGLTVLLLYVAGLSTRYLATVFALGLAAGIPAMLFASYRVARLTSFLDPWADAGGSGYQVIQSMIAFSTGGWIGRGLGEGQAKHLFLPEPWTDFIASVMAEELGLLGFAALLSLYGLLIWRGLVIARRADDLFGNLLASSLTLLLGLQAFFNLGVATGIVPPKGLVLPFLSYGPSALMAHLFTIGLLLNISARPSRPRTVFRRLAAWRRPRGEVTIHRAPAGGGAK